MNDELNTAFVDGELNKTVSGSVEANGWNLLDDPALVRGEEEEAMGQSKILDFSEKEIKGSSGKNLMIAESTIKPQSKPSSQATYQQHKVVDDDDDLIDLFDIIQGKPKPSKK